MSPFPIAIRQLKSLVVGIDYFSKWVEVKTLATIMEKNVRNFVWRNIIYWHEIPRVLVLDNGPFKDYCLQLGIKNHYSSPAHLQANGQVEVMNRSLLKIIRTRLEGAKGIWPNKLLSVLWVYRTTTKTPIGETPFRLAYRSDEVRLL